MDNLIISTYINNNIKNNKIKEEFKNQSVKQNSIFKILHKIRNDDRLNYNYNFINMESKIENNILVYDLKNLYFKNQLLEGIYCYDLTEIINVKFVLEFSDTIINLSLKENYVIEKNKKIKYYSFDDFPINCYGYTSIKLYVSVKNISAEISIINVDIGYNLYNYIFETAYEIMFDNKYVLMFVRGFICSRYSIYKTDFLDYSDLANGVKEEIKKRIEM
jgi:hypothetical protein